MQSIVCRLVLLKSVKSTLQSTGSTLIYSCRRGAVLLWITAGNKRSVMQFPL